MDYAAILIPSLAAGGFLGAVIPIYLDCRALRVDLTAKVLEFEVFLRKASEANQTHAAKIVELEEKVNNVRMYIESAAPSGWKAR